MPKSNRNGQAAILSDRDYDKISNELLSDSHHCFLAIARWTGERWGAVRQLRVGDVYEDPNRRQPRDTIIFRAATRKAQTNGTRSTRSCPVHPRLAESLKAFTPSPNPDAWLFPGKDPLKPITYDGAERWLRRALERAGMASRGISTHSTRRTLITRLARNGIDIKTIAGITGHRDASSLLRYVEAEPQRLRMALATV